MSQHAHSCPLSQRQLIDEYFMEHRAQLLAVAAFLDRLERARSRDAEDDFRVVAFRRALEVLSSGQPGRVRSVQMVFSDQDLRLLERRDQQSALGASGRGEEAEQ